MHTATDHVGVHARAADVFPDLINDQQVDLIKRQRRHQPLRLRTQLRFASGNRIRRDNFKPRSFVQRVFNQCHAAKNRRLGKNHSGQILQRLLVAQCQRACVIRRCPRVLAKANHQHLGQAASHHPVEISVRLHPVDHKYTVRSDRLAAPENLAACCRLPQRRDLHRWPDRHPHRLLRHPVSGQQLQLPLRCGAPVAPHRGDDERLRPGFFQLSDDQ